MSLRRLCLLVVSVLAPSALFAQADLVLRGGRIVTLDDGHPVVEAIAATGDRITAIGTVAEINRLIGPKTQVVELEGRLAIPGFIEGHAHFVGLGQSRMILDLTTATTWEEIEQQVAEAARNKPAGAWIIGRGWHQEKWETPPDPNVHGYPVHTRLSRLTPQHPVVLTHASGHMCFANQRAMELAGVTRETRDPDGGEIVRDAAGEVIGVFRETAQGLVGRGGRNPAQAERELQTAIELATEECLRHGITSFQDAGSSFATIDVFKRLAADDSLRVRLYVMVRDSNQRMARLLREYRTIGAGNNHLTVRAVKRSIDGALGPHGAWLLGAYEDLASSSGLNTASVPSVTRSAELAFENDFQLCVHAIGDRANRETLDIFEKFLSRDDNPKARRWRVEHAQHVHPADIPRFAQLGVIASMQAVHCTSDAVFVLQRLGETRARHGAYVWRSLIDSGAVVTNGTDAPVEKIDPFASFHASVTRELADGTQFFPEQCMTREEALRSYTINGAYAAFEEDIKGTLSVGKLADVAVLSRDIMTCPPDQIRGTKVVHTIVGGRILYSAE